MHPVVWHGPTPLWQELLDEGATARFHRPALLRFGRDSFMEDLTARLAASDPSFTDLVARHETWRNGSRFPELPVTPPAEAVKLYQPAHQRFYLVSAVLVCRTHGLPDRRVDASAEERVSFVLRRVAVEADGTPRDPEHPDYHEYGWFGADGWKRVDDPGRLFGPESAADDTSAAGGGTAGEERLPLFPIRYQPPSSPHSRRLLFGLLPVGKREAYEAAPARSLVLSPEQAADELGDVRLTTFESEVVQALTLLRRGILRMHAGGSSVSATDARDVLVFALLDLAEFLEAHLPEVWASIWDEEAGEPRSPIAWSGSDTLQEAVFARLHQESDRLPDGRSWAEASADAFAGRPEVLRGELDDVMTASEVDPPSAGPSLDGVASSIASLGSLRTLVADALESSEAPAPGAISDAPPAVEALPGSVYVVRCAYEQPRCEKVGRPATVSAPSRPFRLASFFDPDAPARPIRINLPADTSVGGFRKSAKGISMVFSQQLRNQMERVRDAGFDDLDEGTLDDSGGWTLGMICSFSIPIITICALILLMIIVQLLNIVFWWLPFFKICFPIPVKAES